MAEAVVQIDQAKAKAEAELLRKMDDEYLRKLEEEHEQEVAIAHVVESPKLIVRK